MFMKLTINVVAFFLGHPDPVYRGLRAKLPNNILSFST